MFEVTCVGNLVVDVIGKPIDSMPGRGQQALLDRVEMHVGGCAANTGMGLAKMGMDTAVLGRVGNDMPGAFILDALRQLGIDVTGITHDTETPTSVTLVLAHRDGERSFLAYSGANATLGLEHIAFETVRRSKILHVAGALVLPRLDGEPMAQLLQQAKAAGVLTSLDTVWDARGLWMERLAPCLPYVDYLLPSIEEARMLTPGYHAPEDVARCLLDAGASVVGLKMGAQGVYVRSRDGDSLHIPVLPVPCVDTLGAGDAFVAGFLTGVARGWDLEQCARFGNAVGASCVMALGATTGIGSFEETVALMERYQEYRRDGRVHPPAQPAGDNDNG